MLMLIFYYFCERRLELKYSTYNHSKKRQGYDDQCKKKSISIDP